MDNPVVGHIGEKSSVVVWRPLTDCRVVNVHLFGKQLTEPFSTTCPTLGDSAVLSFPAKKQSDGKRIIFLQVLSSMEEKPVRSLHRPGILLIPSSVGATSSLRTGSFPPSPSKKTRVPRRKNLVRPTPTLSDGTLPSAQIRLLPTLRKHACVLFGSCEIVGKRIGPAPNYEKAFKGSTHAHTLTISGCHQVGPPSSRWRLDVDGEKMTIHYYQIRARLMELFWEGVLLFDGNISTHERNFYCSF